MGVIAAKNQNLNKLVEEIKFREDLYFRLNIFPVASIPLLDRKEYIPSLMMHFVERAGLKFNKPGMKVSVVQINHLINYGWPGNIR
ncbi:MAG: transcriptional regulator with PAS, ATPase and Fis domain [Cellvibrionaceae bacterium]